MCILFIFFFLSLYCDIVKFLKLFSFGGYFIGDISRCMLVIVDLNDSFSIYGYYYCVCVFLKCCG